MKIDTKPSLGSLSAYSIDEIQKKLANDFTILYPNLWQTILDQRKRLKAGTYTGKMGFPILIAKSNDSCIPFLTFTKNNQQNTDSKCPFICGIRDGVSQASELVPFQKNTLGFEIDFQEGIDGVTGGSAALASFIAAIFYLSGTQTPTHWCATGCMTEYEIDGEMRKEFSPANSIYKKAIKAIDFGFKKMFVVEGSATPTDIPKSQMEFICLPKNPTDAFIKVMLDPDLDKNNQNLHLTYLFQCYSAKNTSAEMNELMERISQHNNLEGAFAKLILGKNQLHIGNSTKAFKLISEATQDLEKHKTRILDHPLNLMIRLHLPAQLVITYIDCGRELIDMQSFEKGILKELIEIESTFDNIFGHHPTSELGYGLLALRNSIGRFYEYYGAIHQDEQAFEKAWHYRIKMKPDWVALYEYAEVIPHFKNFDLSSQYNQCVDILYRIFLKTNKCPVSWLDDIKDHMSQIKTEAIDNMFNLLALTRWRFVNHNLDEKEIAYIWQKTTTLYKIDHCFVAICDLLLWQLQIIKKVENSLYKEIIDAVKESGVYKITDKNSILNLLKLRTMVVLKETITLPENSNTPLNKIIVEFCKNPETIFRRMIY